VDQEDVARVVQKYDFNAVPVVDNSLRLVGVVTVDDVLDVIQQEASEDILGITGAKVVHPLHDSVLTRVGARFPWLAITVFIQLGIAWAIRGYEETLQKFWLLAAFFPIIMAIGGSVGLQSATIVVRGLATGEITLGRAGRVLLAELQVGLLIGTACGLISGVMAYLMRLGTPEAVHFGVTVSVSMLAGITFAATFGTFIPFACQRMKVDPAIASGPFITTLNDILSIIIYLSLAVLLL
jgi:magnesium transporter